MVRQFPHINFAFFKRMHANGKPNIYSFGTIKRGIGTIPTYYTNGQIQSLRRRNFKDEVIELFEWSEAGELTNLIVSGEQNIRKH